MSTCHPGLGALALGCVLATSVSAVTMTSLSSFEGIEEPNKRYYPGNGTFTSDSYVNITNVSAGQVQMLLRYSSTWWDNDVTGGGSRTDRQRAEVRGLGAHQKANQTFDYAFSWRTSPSFPSSSKFVDFFQLKATDGDAALPVIIGDVRGGVGAAAVKYLTRTGSSHQTARSVPTSLNTWQGLRIRIKTPSNGSNTGICQAAVNGDALRGVTGVDLSRPSSTDYRPKWGLYRGVGTGMALGTQYLQYRSVSSNRIN